MSVELLDIASGYGKDEYDEDGEGEGFEMDDPIHLKALSDFVQGLNLKVGDIFKYYGTEYFYHPQAGALYMDFDCECPVIPPVIEIGLDSDLDRWGGSGCFYGGYFFTPNDEMLKEINRILSSDEDYIMVGGDSYMVSVVNDDQVLPVTKQNRFGVDPRGDHIIFIS